MEVYDFSMRGRAEHLHEQPNPDLGGVRYLAPTGVVAQLPWDIDELLDMNGSHGNVVFLRVSSLFSFFAARLNNALRVVAQMPNGSTEDDLGAEEGVLHMWSF